ncbi:MAG: tandem-95 repeat protein [Abyssibacter sp.]|nr:Ig-like domain-containing protein [Abyssibacter sp.]MCK5859986.1 tandem-95 repeat protein [Abyssibacter sp.]
MIDLSPRARLLPLALISATALAACGGGSTSSQSGIQGTASKGPLVNASIEIYAIDAAGLPAGDPLGVATTDANGEFSFSERPAEGPLLLISTGGTYIDEGDPEPDPAARRQITLGAQEGLRSLLPAGQNSLAITPFSQMVYQRALREAAGSNFISVFGAAQAQAATALGFDPISVQPANPVAPAADASDAQVAYALTLGGFASYLNGIAISLGTLPTYQVLEAVLFDFSDGRLDSLADGVSPITIGESESTLPSGFDLNDEIRRFRNNHFDQYQAAVLVQVDTDTLGGELQPTNNNPVAANDTVNIVVGSGGVTIDVLANDTDADGDTLSVDSIGTPSAGGTAVLGSGGGIEYTPPAEFVGVDSFSYQISDGNGGSDSATVTVNITSPSNTPPVANDDTATTDENTAVTGIPVLSNDSDAESDPLTVIAVGTPVNGGTATVSGQGTTVDYTPATGFSGTDSFAYTISDGQAQASATVTVTVNNVASAPVAIDDNASVAEDGSVVIEVFANDTDADGDLDTTTTQLVAAPSDGAATVLPSGAVQYSPSANFFGSDQFTYRIFDQAGLPSNVAIVSITVTSSNDAPVANADAATTDEDTAVVINVVANDTDVDGTIDPSSVLVTTGPTDGSIAVTANGTVTYTPAADFAGTDSFSYTVADNDGAASDPAVVTITVTAVNDPPSTTDQSFALNEDEPLSAALTADDADGDSLSYSLGELSPTNGSVNLASDGSFTYTPSDDFNGTDSFSFVVSDGQAFSNARTATLTIAPVNDAPTIAGTPPTVVDAGDLYTFTPTAEDVDGDELTFTVLNLPSWASFDTSTGTLSGTPSEGDAGSYADVSIGVVDPQQASALLPFFDIDVLLRSAETGFNTAFFEINSDAGTEGNAFGTFSVFQDTGRYDIQPPSNGTAQFTSGPFQGAGEGEINATFDGYFLQFFPPETDPADTFLVEVNESGVLFANDPFEQYQEPGNDFFERDYPLAIRLLPTTADMYQLAIAERDDVFGTGDSDGDSNPDFLNANAKRSDGANFAFEFALRQSAAFETTRLDGDYGFVGLAVNLESGPMTAEAFLVEHTIDANGATAGDERFASEQMRYDPFGSPLTTISSEDGPDTGFVTTYAANADGTLTASYSDQGSPDGNASGFASPDGGLLVLQETITEDSGQSVTAVEQILQFGVRRPATTAALTGTSYRVDALGLERSADDGESYVYLLQSATLNFMADGACVLNFREGQSLFLSGRPDDIAPFDALPGDDAPAEAWACTYTTQDRGSVLIELAGDQVDPSSTFFEGYVNESGEVLALRGFRNEPGAFYQRWLMMGALDTGYVGLDNLAPTIELAADTMQVDAGGAINLTATVGDPDTGDTLSVQWYATTGSFTSQTGTNTTWMAPADGSGTTLLTAEVFDGRDARIADIRVTWGLNNLPRSRASVQYASARGIHETAIDPSDIIHGWFALNPIMIFDGSDPSCSTGTLSSSFEDADNSTSITAGDSASITFTDCLIENQAPIIDAIYNGTLLFDIDVADQSVENLPNVDAQSATGNERNYQWRIVSEGFSDAEDGCTSNQNFAGQLLTFAQGETGLYYGVEDGGNNQTVDFSCEDGDSGSLALPAPFAMSTQLDTVNGSHLYETSYRLTAKDGNGVTVLDWQVQTDPNNPAIGPLDTFEFSTAAKPEDPTSGTVQYSDLISGMTSLVTSLGSTVQVSVDANGDASYDAQYVTAWDFFDVMTTIEPVFLDGQQEVPPVDTSASGLGYVVLHLHDEGDLHLDADVTVSGFTPTQAHLHEAPFGQNGPIVITLQADPVDAQAYFVEQTAISSQDVDTMLAGGWYLNVHSSTHPGGEVRGQLTDGEGDDFGVVDSDFDGLSDAEEINIYGTNPENPDSDDDGLSDGDEVLFTGTDPNSADTDGDGASDSVENGFGSDPFTANVVRYVSVIRGSTGGTGTSWDDAYVDHFQVQDDFENNGSASNDPVYYLYETGSYGGQFRLGDIEIARSNIAVVGGLGPNDHIADPETIFTTNGDGNVATIDNAFGIYIRGVTFTGGFGSQGGGIDVGPTTPTDLVLSDVIVTGNNANFGGGIHVDNDSSVLISTSVVQDNSAESGSSIALGGGVAIASGFVDIAFSDVHGNRAAGFPSVAEPQGGGGVYAGPNSFLSIIGTRIANNQSGFGGGQIDLGGGVYADNAAVVEIYDSMILSNGAITSGGGVYVADSTSSTILNNNLIVGNTSLSNHGGGVFVSRQGAGLAQIALNTFALNQSQQAEFTGGLYADFASSGLELRDNILWSNDDGDTTGSTGMENYQGPVTDDGDFTIGNLIEFNNIEDVLTLGSPIGSNDLVTAVGGNATTANPDFSASFYLGPSNASEDFDTTRSAEGQELGNTTTQVDGRFDDGALDLGYHEPFGKGATLPTDANPDMTVLACDQFGDAQRDVVFRPSAFEAETGSGHAFAVDVDAAFNVTVAGRTNLDPVGSGNSTYVIDRGDGSYSFRVFTQVLSGSFTVDLSFGVGQEPVESFNISYDYNSCGQQS